ncbi:MAG TPA: hypothetical protein VH062_16870 [Polyangiaceae bacterium]|jgi:hypothetical protein|nr:hypothetical protein [Polyangiaceae bacterium]
MTDSTTTSTARDRQGATPLSERVLTVALSSPLSALARLSLLVVPMTCAAGCLDTPPDYTEPTRNPPVITTGLVVPSTSSLVVSSGTVIEFTAPFRADDIGERLLAVFVLDQGLGNPVGIRSLDVESDTRPFAEQKRTVTYDWPWNNGTLSGCHTMTLIISDQSNIDNFIQPIKAELAASVTWFLLLQPSGETSDTLPMGCFQPHQTSGTTQ